jgi:hypothetical protein
MLTMF